jgi:hypothetical protein
MKMKFRERIPIVIFLITLLVSQGCQKVINVDLNDAEPKIVIEGLVTDKPGPYTVKISKSGSYFSDSILPVVSGASVVIADDAGIIDTLTEVTPGVYLTSLTRGFPGRTYTLTVISEGQEYTGSSEMSSHVRIDSLMLMRAQSETHYLTGDAEDNLEIHCFFKDPDEKNYYRIKIFENDSIDPQSYKLYDDQYTNGEETELRIEYASEGNTYRVQLLSIDKPTYDYYNALGDLLYINPLFGSTPANPDNNLSNGALGYFGTCAISTKIIVIPPGITKSLK